MSPRTWARLRLAGGVAVLAYLVWVLGTGPFIDGIRTVDATALLAGLLLGVPTTVCCAWRWSLITRRRGIELPLRPAVVAYYRSQLLNTTLPIGVLGDVHRGVRHGLSPVVLERVAGQVVQVAMAALALLLLPSPWDVPALLLVAVALPCLVMLFRWPGIVLSSTLAVGCLVATFVVAAHTAGVDTSLANLVPLGLVVLVAMSIPVNVAGFGPREGVAAWAFAAAGLGADLGVATAVVYGVMALVAALPGVVVLLVDRRREVQETKELVRA